MSRQVTLYVKSAKNKVEKEQVVKRLARTWRVPPPWGTGDASSTYEYSDVESISHYDYVLPKDQQKMVEDVKELGATYGFNVEVVDLAKKNSFSRFKLEHTNKIRTIPSIVTDTGKIVEGMMTKDQLDILLSKTAKER